MKILEIPRPWLWYTVGPATDDSLAEILRDGPAVLRHTLSYATPELHIGRARRAAEIAASLGTPLASIADLPGEKFRLGSFLGEQLTVEADAHIALGMSADADLAAITPVLPLQSDALFKAVTDGTRIIVGDGGVELEVLAIDTYVECRVIRAGTIEHNRGLTLVGATREPRSLMSVDRDHLAKVVESAIFDAVAVSFASDSGQLAEVKDIVSSTGMAVIAKIETRQGVDDLAEVCKVADILMAARGDLALAIDTPLLYAAVKEISDEAARAGKPWVLATQLLEGLDAFGFPTRAELCDAVAWMDRGAAGAMLSRESVFGGHALESISLLRRLLTAPRTWT